MALFCFDAAGCGQSEGLEVVTFWDFCFLSLSFVYFVFSQQSFCSAQGSKQHFVFNGRHVNSTAALVKESSICEVVTTGLLNSSMAAGISRNTQTLKPCASMAVERRGRCRLEVLKS